MIVLDASIVIDLLLALPPHFDAIAARVQAEAAQLAAPHLLDAEVGQVLRRYVITEQLSASFAEAALQDLEALPVTRYPHLPLLPRAFQLRQNATIYDGIYLALAEALDAPLLTRDAALAQGPRVSTPVEVIG